MSPRRIWAVLLLAGTALCAQAQTPDPTSWLGLTPPSAYSALGAPAEVFPLAVDENRWQVVHFYPDHSYLFFYQNRVWQVRLDKLWTAGFQGITMGMRREAAEATLGPPLARGEAWSVWALPYQTFPRKIRLVFTEGLLTDAYLYRSDL